MYSVSEEYGSTATARPVSGILLTVGMNDVEFKKLMKDFGTLTSS